jgi:hypothetical protein
MTDEVDTRPHSLQRSLDETRNALEALTNKLDSVERAGRWNWIVTALVCVLVAIIVGVGIYIWRDGINRDQATTQSRILACQSVNDLRVATLEENRNQDRRLVEAAIQLSGGDFSRAEAEQFLGIVAQGDTNPALLPVDCEKSVRGE